MSCAIASDTKLETPEGPFTIKTVSKTPTSVMTRTEDGAVRFAMSSDRQIVEARPVLRITLDNGRSLRVGPDQILFGAGMAEVAARDLKAGDKLESVFAFPPGYVYKTDEGEELTSDGTVSVVSVADGGEADTISLRVGMTGRLVFSAGIFGRAAA